MPPTIMAATQQLTLSSDAAFHFFNSRLAWFVPLFTLRGDHLTGATPPAFATAHLFEAIVQ